MKKIILLSAIFVYCLNAGYAQVDGDLDSSFGSHGIILSGFGIETYFTTTAIQNDGKIVAAGYTFNGSPNLLVARYNINGSADSSFDSDGVQTSNFFSAPNAMVIQNDGKIVLAVPGSIIRYNTDGSFDNTFIASAPFNINAIAIQSDGKIVGAGYQPNGNNFDVMLVRYNSDGSLDNSFSNDGKQVTDLGGLDDEAHSIAIQSDGKIIIAGTSNFNFAIARYNADGTLDNSFSSDGKQTTNIGGVEDGTSLAIQPDGKIVVGGNIYKNGKYAFCLARYNMDGILDNSFSIDGKQVSNFTSYAYTIKNSFAIQAGGKIIMGGNSSLMNDNSNQFTFIRYKTDGSIDSTFSNNGKQFTDIGKGSALLYSIVIADNKLYAVGFSQIPNHQGAIARYVLNGKEVPPTVNITTPANDTTYIAAARIKIRATASDEDGTISKVEFYNGNQLLNTEHEAPYDCVLPEAPEGHYIITAKATDNHGNVTISAPVNISVVPDIAPTINITSPVNGASFTAPVNIILSADAKDADGKIKTVEFYNGSKLIFTETAAPYYRKWFRVPEGNYSITAVATDNKGKRTTSAPVEISVRAPGKLVSSGGKLDLSNKALNFNLNPNPVAKTLNISIEGLQTNKKSAVSLLSVSGVVIKTIKSGALNKNVQLDVSSLSAGVYFIKIINGDKILYKQFVKM